MNGIQLKPMPRYQRTQFEEEDPNNPSDGSVIFPPDITRGFSNPNSSFESAFKSTVISSDVIASGETGGTSGNGSGGGGIGVGSSNDSSSLHPMVHLQRNTLGKTNHNDNSVPGVQFFKGKILRPFGIKFNFSSSQSSNGTFLNNRSTLEKFLLLLSIFMCVLVVVLISLVYFRKVHCITPTCVTVAASIINSMDATVDPCQDFYSYACGGWIKANPLPDGKSIWGSFNKLSQENQLVMKKVLEEENSNFTSRAEDEARIYYKSCLDINETVEIRGSEPLKQFIKSIGGWSITNDFDETKWNFQDTLELIHNKYNRGGNLFSWAVGPDERNSSNNIIQVDQSSLILPSREYYLNQSAYEKVIKAYSNYMIKIGQLLGGEENSTREQMNDVFNFETRIANITIPANERRDDERMYNKMTVKELQEIAPFINWIHYFNSAFDQVNYTIDENTSIVVYSPDYLRNLSSLIQEYNSTEQGRITLANFMVWSSAQTLAGTMSKTFKDAYKILKKALIGTDGFETPWRYCVSDTNSIMGFAMGAMFVKSVFKGKSKEMAESMIQEIKDAFIDNLPHLHWMDPDTRAFAREKANAITDMIGFPDFILDPVKLDERYHGLTFEEDEYFENNIKVSQFTLLKNLEKIYLAANKSEWEMGPPAVNAYYQPTKNQIVFPAGILQAPFYDVNHPKSLNFGAMGVVMGHELTHAFDDQGREYDKEGNLHQWWHNKTLLHFAERIQCFIDQYSNYTIDGEHLDGRATIGENLADNGGLKAAFNAYEAWMKTHDEMPLPGLSMSNRQLFFMGFAQVWCSVNTPEALKLQILQDPHSPSIYRVIGTLSNSYEFAREFNCPLGSPMNPEKKCTVW